MRVRVICLTPFSAIFPLYCPLDNKYMYPWVLYRMESCWLTLEIGLFLSKITNTIDIYTTLFVIVFIIVHLIFHLVGKVLQQNFFSSRLSNNNFFLNCLLNIKLFAFTSYCCILRRKRQITNFIDLTEVQTVKHTIHRTQEEHTHHYTTNTSISLHMPVLTCEYA